ncbi:MAG: hypothetical protein KDB03_03145, partial [Planctomycetales bacterium]|nr:hypothetical protein [Planctomycetales bacterium]
GNFVYRQRGSTATATGWTPLVVKGAIVETLLVDSEGFLYIHSGSVVYAQRGASATTSNWSPIRTRVIETAVASKTLYVLDMYGQLVRVTGPASTQLQEGYVASISVVNDTLVIISSITR